MNLLCPFKAYGNNTIILAHTKYFLRIVNLDSEIFGYNLFGRKLGAETISVPKIPRYHKMEATSKWEPKNSIFCFLQSLSNISTQRLEYYLIAKGWTRNKRNDQQQISWKTLSPICTKKHIIVWLLLFLCTVISCILLSLFLINKMTI